jgi:nucleotide-binding universal stress UspA family protein
MTLGSARADRDPADQENQMTDTTMSIQTSPVAVRDGDPRTDDRGSQPGRPIAARTVVVGYDGSPEARAAFTAALERAGADGHVVAVHATTPTSSWLGASYHDPAVVDRLRAGEAVLDQLHDDLDDIDASVDVELIEGDPAEVLLRVAAVRDADEIVVGSRGLGRLRATLGSVSQALVRSADRPVVVVPDGAADGAGSLGAATDSSH